MRFYITMKEYQIFKNHTILKLVTIFYNVVRIDYLGEQ